MRKAFLQLHLAVFLAGFTGVLGELITLNEGLLVWYRLLITAVSMWILYSFTRKLQPIATRDKIKLAGVGFLAALHWVTFYGSIKYANVSVALVCFSATGFFTALLEPLILRRSIIWIELLLGLLVIAGISIIFHFDPRYKTGILLGVASAVFLAIVMILLKQFVARINSETMLTWQISGGLLTLTGVMPFYLQQFPVASYWPGWENMGWLVVLSLFCSVWAFRLSADALKKLSAFTVNLTFNLEPLYGIILAFLLFKENKNLNHWFYTGLLLIVFSVVLNMLRIQRMARRSSKPVLPHE
jgi:drug/metabolite transporter (DMT)-like permease